MRGAENGREMFTEKLELGTRRACAASKKSLQGGRRGMQKQAITGAMGLKTEQKQGGTKSLMKCVSWNIQGLCNEQRDGDAPAENGVLW